MIAQTFKKISAELEDLIMYDISLERAIDLLEASTQDLEELVVINTLRETLSEMRRSPKASELDLIFPSTPPHTPEKTDYLHA